MRLFSFFFGLGFGLSEGADVACNAHEEDLPFNRDVHQTVQGDILLQAKTSGFKAPVPSAEEPDPGGFQAPKVKEVGDGEENVRRAIVKTVNDVNDRIRGSNHSQAQNTSEASAGVASSRRRSTFQVNPPLKEPASQADENYKHDQQSEGNTPESQDIDSLEPSSVKDAMEVAISIILLCFVALLMISFYLVNWPNVDIRQATWGLFSTTISIFLAVLLFTATQDFMSFYEQTRGLPQDHMPEDESSEHGPVTVHHMFLSLLRYLGLLIILQIVLFFVDTKDVVLHGLSRLGSHIVAFAGMDVFAALQESEVFPRSLTHNFGGFVVSVFIVWGIFDVAEFLRWRLVRDSLKGNDRIHKARQQWFAECREGEHEAAGLILGLLQSQQVRFAITGLHAPLHGGSARYKTFRQVWSLFGFGLLLGVATVPIEICVALLLHGLSDFTGRINFKRWSARLIGICRETLAMTMAWCFLYWGQWEFWYMTANWGVGWGSQISASLSIAILLSALCFSGIFVIEFVLDLLENHKAHQAGFIALGKSLGLVMGLGWETCFRQAIKGASKIQMDHHHAFRYMVSNVTLIAILCLVVLPAWLLFIHPKALENRRDTALEASGHGNNIDSN